MRAKAMYELVLLDAANTAKAQAVASPNSPQVSDQGHPEKTQQDPGGIGLNPFGSTTTASVSINIPPRKEGQGGAFYTGLVLLLVVVIFIAILEWRKNR
jgi:hypothetical protein